MADAPLTWITNFIWGIADDVLRDLYVRGKYRDVILPMTVLRRLDAVLEPTKASVLAMKETLDAAGIDNQDAPLRQAAGQAFYNTSRFTLRDLRSRHDRPHARRHPVLQARHRQPRLQTLAGRDDVRRHVRRGSNVAVVYDAVV
jgi:type I restriction enzyme M protein